MAWTRTRLEVPAIAGDPPVLLATPPPDGGWTPRLEPNGYWWTGQPSINPESEAVKRGGKPPVLRIGAIGLCASSRLASLGLRAICGLLLFRCRLPDRFDCLPAGITVEVCKPNMVYTITGNMVYTASVLVWGLAYLQGGRWAMRGRSPKGGRSPTEGERPGSLPLMPLLGRG